MVVRGVRLLYVPGAVVYEQGEGGTNPSRGGRIWATETRPPRGARDA